MAGVSSVKEESDMRVEELIEEKLEEVVREISGPECGECIFLAEEGTICEIIYWNSCPRVYQGLTKVMEDA